MRASKFKYNNTPVVVDGFRFDSKREASQWCMLKVLQSQGKIRNLKRQVRFKLGVNGQHICDYIADFTYEQAQPDGQWLPVVEDTKGVRTEVYELKRRLMLAVHGIQIRES